MPTGIDPQLFKHTVDAQRFDAAKMQKISLFETEQMFCDIYCLRPGHAQRVHAHAGAAKVYVVLKGTPTFTIGDAEAVAGPQDAVLAPADVPHGVRNDSDGDAVCLVFMAPNPNK